MVLPCLFSHAKVCEHLKITMIMKYIKCCSVIGLLVFFNVFIRANAGVACYVCKYLHCASNTGICSTLHTQLGTTSNNDENCIDDDFSHIQEEVCAEGCYSIWAKYSGIKGEIQYMRRECADFKPGCSPTDEFLSAKYGFSLNALLGLYGVVPGPGDRTSYFECASDRCNVNPFMDPNCEFLIDGDDVPLDSSQSLTTNTTNEGITPLIATSATKMFSTTTSEIVTADVTCYACHYLNCTSDTGLCDILHGQLDTANSNDENCIGDDMSQVSTKICPIGCYTIWATYSGDRGDMKYMRRECADFKPGCSSTDEFLDHEYEVNLNDLLTLYGAELDSDDLSSYFECQSDKCNNHPFMDPSCQYQIAPAPTPSPTVEGSNQTGTAYSMHAASMGVSVLFGYGVVRLLP